MVLINMVDGTDQSTTYLLHHKSHFNSFFSCNKQVKVKHQTRYACLPLSLLFLGYFFSLISNAPLSSKVLCFKKGDDHMLGSHMLGVDRILV